jgi:hypothetical protein
MRRFFLLGFLGVGCYDITIQPSTNLPPRTQGEVLTGSEDTDVIVSISQLLENDADPEGDTELTLELVANTATNGTATQGADNITFTPDQNFAGVASFSYIVRDESGVESVPTTVNIDFSNTNDSPVALDPGSINVNEDTPTTIILRATDIDSADLTFEILANPPLARGELELVQEQATSATFLYTPNPNEFGADNFRFQVRDSGDFISEIISVDINIGALNDAPIVLPDVSTVTRGSSVPIDVLANDTDPESANNALSLEIFIAPLSGTATIENGQIRYSATDETLGPVIFFYRARDAANAISAPAQVTVTVNRTCGDGFVDANDGEQCDELNGTGCEADCTFTCAGSLDPDATATNDDSCYATFRQGNINFSTDWNAAVSFCSQNGGQLVVIKDLDENDLVRSTELSLSTDVIWIGASDQGVEEDLTDNIRGDDFLWVDNTFIGAGFSDFATGQPNNGNGTEDCLYMLETGEWDDTDCTNPSAGGVFLVNSMICEFPLP